MALKNFLECLQRLNAVAATELTQLGKKAYHLHGETVAWPYLPLMQDRPSVPEELTVDSEPGRYECNNPCEKDTFWMLLLEFAGTRETSASQYKRPRRSSGDPGRN